MAPLDVRRAGSNFPVSRCFAIPMVGISMETPA